MGVKSKTIQNKKFSLVELLIVISIIAILISLINPAIKRMTNRAYITVCANNLKNMSHAFTMYLDDYYNIFPPHRNKAITWTWADKLMPYLSTSDIYRCPSMEEWVSEKDGVTILPVEVLGSMGAHRMPYGYNGFWLGLDSHPGWIHPSNKNYTRLSEVPNPSQVMTVADSRMRKDNTWSSTLWYPRRSITGEAWGEGISDIHNVNRGNEYSASSRANIEAEGGSNLAFVDGHVGWHTYHDVNVFPGNSAFWWKTDNGTQWEERQE